MSAPRSLSILVVEDELLAVLELEELLEAKQCRILGPVNSVAAAMRIIEDEEVDVALLDIELGSENAFPVADTLAARGTPFIFLSGHSPRDLPERFVARPYFRKPYRPDQIFSAAIDAVFEAAGRQEGSANEKR